MANPYEVLGIDENSSDSKVKEAYIAMQKKYDPDSYDKDELKSIAKEKTQEITDAFDRIMNERRVKRMQMGKPATDNMNSDEESTNDYNKSTGFSQVRALIDENDLQQAEMVLDSISQEGRTAEWYYLKGTIFFKKGWLDDATNFFTAAVKIDPKNQVYRDALNRAIWQRKGNFGAPGSDSQGGVPYPMQGAGCSGCDLCGGLLCADCCCECMGGDFIRCC